MFLGPSGMQYTKLKIHEIRHDLSGTLVRDGMFSMPAKGLTVYAPVSYTHLTLPTTPYV